MLLQWLFLSREKTSNSATYKSMFLTFSQILTADTFWDRQVKHRPLLCVKTYFQLVWTKEKIVCRHVILYNLITYLPNVICIELCYVGKLT